MALAYVKNWERSMFDEMELNLSLKKNTAGEKKQKLVEVEFCLCY